MKLHFVQSHQSPNCLHLESLNPKDSIYRDRNDLIICTSAQADIKRLFIKFYITFSDEGSSCSLNNKSCLKDVSSVYTLRELNLKWQYMV